MSFSLLIDKNTRDGRNLSMLAGIERFRAFAVGIIGAQNPTDRKLYIETADHSTDIDKLDEFLKKSILSHCDSDSSCFLLRQRSHSHFRCWHHFQRNTFSKACCKLFKKTSGALSLRCLPYNHSVSVILFRKFC